MKLFTVYITILLFVLNFTLCYSQNPETIKLKDYRPKSIFQIPVTKIEKAKYPVIDMHSHEYATSMANLAEWVKIMDKAGVEKTIVLTQSAGRAFDSLYANYSKYPNRFELWCGFDYTGYTEPGWTERAVKELERCHKLGAKGVGEITDKGLGDPYAVPVPSEGMHLDDPKMMPLYKKCAALKMPVNIHVADPMWMYEPMDSTNDGLMNAYTWRIDLKAKGLRNHAELIITLENIVRENPQTTFIACHLANCEYKLVIISAANEVALVGSTMLALTAGGVFKDLNEASEKMLKGGKRIEPDKTATAVHDKRYSFFKKLREILGPLYREHAELRFEK